jgi:CheY-like chemotaxis protein
MLTDLGFKTSLAPNAAEGLARLEQDEGEIDIVFTDVVMPGMNGVEFAKAVRQRWPDLPIVLTTGYSQTLAEETGHGFPLLQKPYSVETLSRTLRCAAETVAGGSLPAR